MDTEKQVIDRLQQANNVLLTVSNNPSVDQLAACIGLSIALNKLGKHATAVFSGAIPSTIEFLQPQDTIEKNTDSLRDFIISLDKAKADKLRYKVEDTVVKIFITPYKTSITDADLEFSQGDFNVDVVLAIGIHDQKDLDQAITAHGRILHDATVVTVNNQEGDNELGTIHWVSTEASSLSEMATLLATGLSADVLDEQIATALLTGIVAETDRFSNDKTTSNTMNISASLMSAGANQQLVASKLEEEQQPEPEAPESKPSDDEDNASNEQSDARITDDGTLEINHDNDETPTPPPLEDGSKDTQPENEPDKKEGPEAKPEEVTQKASETKPSRHYNRSARIQPEESPFTSATDPNGQKPEPYIDPLTLPPVRDTPVTDQDTSKVTLQDLEKQIGSSHVTQTSPDNQPKEPSAPQSHVGEELNLDDLQRPAGLDEPEAKADPVASVDAARDAVAAAMSSSNEPLAPIASLNAKPLGNPLHSTSSIYAPPSAQDDASSAQVTSQTPPPQDGQLPTFPQASPASSPLPSVSPLTPAQNSALPSLPQSPLPTPDANAVPSSDQLMTMPLPPANPLQPPVQQDQQNNNNDSNSAPPVPPPIVPPFPGQ